MSLYWAISNNDLGNLRSILKPNTRGCSHVLTWEGPMLPIFKCSIQSEQYKTKDCNMKGTKSLNSNNSKRELIMLLFVGCVKKSLMGLRKQTQMLCHLSVASAWRESGALRVMLENRGCDGAAGWLCSNMYATRQHPAVSPGQCPPENTREVAEKKIECDGLSKPFTLNNIPNEKKKTHSRQAGKWTDGVVEKVTDQKCWK